MSTSTLTGRAHGANGRRATSGSSIDICLRIEHKSTCFTAVLSAAPFYSLHSLSFVLLTFASRWSCFMQGYSLNEHSLLFPRQFCSLNFLIAFDTFLCTFLGRYWPAVSVVRHGHTITNSISVQLWDGCSIGKVYI